MSGSLSPSETSLAANFPDEYKHHLLRAIDTIDSKRVTRAIQMLAEARDHARTIFVCGNGGSASTASHFACDIVKGASFQRDSRFRIMALTDSMATITAYSNDVSYDCIFTEQLRNFARTDDVVMAISGSGNSPNVVNAIEFAKSIGCRTIALTGRDGGKLGAAAELQIHVDAPHMGRIEDAHLVICHMICYSFMDRP